MNKESYVDYQARATQFAVGDIVYPFLGSADQNGRVVAVWPGIGMVDVQWPQGEERYPVEELNKLAPDAWYQPPEIIHDQDSVPGGATKVPVSTGQPVYMKFPEETLVNKIANRYMEALYWAEKDRKYRAKQSETENGYTCPRCGENRQLRKAVYKRRGGASTHLLCCPKCLFLIKQEDVL